MNIPEEVKKLREQYPEMFQHPELKSNEVWVGDFVVDVVYMQTALWREEGLPSVRIGLTKTFTTVEAFCGSGARVVKEKLTGIACLPVFALAEEFVQFAN